MLQFAIQSGMIDLTTVQAAMYMNEREKCLSLHNYKIWQSEDGKWHTHFDDVKNKRIRRDRNTKEEIEELVISYYKDDSIITIEDAFEEWLDRRLRLSKISEVTAHRYRQVFKRHYSVFGKVNIENVSSDDFVEFLEEQIPDKGLDSKAYSNLKTVTRGFLKRAKKRKLIDWNITEMFDDVDVSERDFKHKVIDDSREIFDEYEMKKVIDYCKSNQTPKNLAVLFLFGTGVRVGEIAALKPDAFLNNNSVVQIKRMEKRIPKKDGGYDYIVFDVVKTQAGYRNIVIPSDFHFIYKEMRKIDPSAEYVFSENGKRLRTFEIRDHIYYICKKLGIVKKSPHKARKTYGTILLDNNLDKKFIEGQMGHTDISCTENHYHRNRRHIEEKQRIIDNIPDFKCV